MRVVDVWDPGTELLVALVRHGQTAWNAEKRFLGVTDLDLDEEGERQALTLQNGLPVGFDRVYCSPLTRARRTAAAFATQVSIVPEFAEMNQGELEGLDRAEAVARFPDFFSAWTADRGHVCAPGGESVKDVVSRTLSRLTEICSQHRPGEKIAVVSHQIVIASLTCTFRGEPLQHWSNHGIPNTAVTLVGWDGARFSVRERGWRVAQ